MLEKILHPRIQLKHDTEAKWNQSNLIPKEGEAIIYSVDSENTAPRLKIGDGNNKVTNLPFIEANYIIKNKEVTNEKLANSSITIGTKLINLGDEVSLKDIGVAGQYKTIQQPVPNPSFSQSQGSTISFISDISQNSNGVISPSRKLLPIASTTNAGIVQLSNEITDSQYNAATSSAVKVAYDIALGAMPKSGGTFTGTVTLASDPTTNLEAATKQYVDNHVQLSGTLGTGTQIGILTINGTATTIYTPNAAPMTIQVQPASNTPTAEFIVSTNTESSSELTGVLGSTDAIANGKIIYYMTKYELPASEVTMKLRYSSSSDYTASIPIYSYGNTRTKAPYPAGIVLTLVYYNNAFYLTTNTMAVVK